MRSIILKSDTGPPLQRFEGYAPDLDVLEIPERLENVLRREAHGTESFNAKARNQCFISSDQRKISLPCKIGFLKPALAAAPGKICISDQLRISIHVEGEPRRTCRGFVSPDSLDELWIKNVMSERKGEVATCTFIPVQNGL